MDQTASFAQEKGAGPILFIGLDAFDPKTARELAAAGELPAIARLMREGATVETRNPLGTFVGSIWPSFAANVRADLHDFYCYAGIEVETYCWRLYTANYEGYPTFWKRIGDAGRRVLAIDIPHAKAAPLNGVELVEWAAHDHHHGFHTWPPERAARLKREHPIHPVFGVRHEEHSDFAGDDHAFRKGHKRTEAEDEALLTGLLAGVDLKRQVVGELLAEEPWDLALAVYSEGHATGHGQWALHDKTHPEHNAALVARMGDPILQVYRALDAAVGQHMDQARPGTTFMVLLSHGMGPHNDSTHLIEPALIALDRAYRGRSHVQTEPPAKVPEKSHWIVDVRRAFLDSLPEPFAGIVRETKERLVAAPSRARRMFFDEPNNTAIGGVRINLKGREPKGVVDPADMDEVCRRLQEDLVQLVCAKTGRQLITRVIRSDYRQTPGSRIADLFLEWDKSAITETAWSPKTGVISAPYRGWRTGDHTPDGLLIVSGPGIAPGPRTPPVQVEDLGPSIAARFGVELPGIDGKVVPWLAAEAGVGARPHELADL